MAELQGRRDRVMIHCRINRWLTAAAASGSNEQSSRWKGKFDANLIETLWRRQRRYLLPDCGGRCFRTGEEAQPDDPRTGPAGT
jgi:hypothetical protein